MLRISDLTCERDDRVLFEGLNYEFPKGQVTQIEGENGAGKTTLLRIMAGLFTSYSGKVLWNDQSIYKSRVEFNQQLLFLGHKSAIKINLTPIENLKFLIGIKQQVTLDSIYHALEQVGLCGYEHVVCRNLSAGQQRRVTLASLYLTNASTWILDEVFTAIDRRGVSVLESFLYEKAKSGVTIILTTHHQLSLPQFSILNISQFSNQNTDIISEMEV